MTPTSILILLGFGIVISVMLAIIVTLFTDHAESYDKEITSLKNEISALRKSKRELEQVIAEEYNRWYEFSMMVKGDKHGKEG